MGKLRIEPKVKPPVDEAEYEHLKKILRQAREAAEKNHVFWDLDPQEKPQKMRKSFLYVAEKEGIDLKIRAKRKSRTLSLRFGDPGDREVKQSRMSANESKNRIISTLSKSSEPLQKSDIISATEISPSTWNVRIKELLREGSVKRKGSGRETRYVLAKK